MKLKCLPVLAIVALSAAAQSPYINKVFEFRPAPGQFVNQLPEYEPGDDYAAMLAKAEEAVAFDRQPGAVSLGAFGGYIVFGFDHTIVNVAGEYDFKIYGNAIISDRNNQGGSCEPGVIWVSRDENGNGLPDDRWYEIAGSEYSNPITRHDYTVTYTRPAAGHIPTPDPANKHITDTSYIPWSASDGTSGYLEANDYNPGSYWPEWLPEDQLSFSGTCLPGNVLDVNGDGSYFVLKMLGWGYADNCPNSKFEGIKIDWAVDAAGLPANLPGVDFVKVVTGMHQRCGALGETSTEVCGAEDLHPQQGSVETILSAPVLRARINAGTLTLFSPCEREMSLSVYSASGVLVRQIAMPAGYSTHELGLPAGGIYILSAPGIKAIKVQAE